MPRPTAIDAAQEVRERFRDSSLLEIYPDIEDLSTFWRGVFQLYVGRKKHTTSKLLSLRFNYDGSIAREWDEVANEMGLKSTYFRHVLEIAIRTLTNPHVRLRLTNATPDRN